MSYLVEVQFQRVGPPGKLAQPDDRKRVAVVERGTFPAPDELARTVSGEAVRLFPTLKGRPLRVRITTPDGSGSTNPCFFLEGRDTANRYGYGFIRVVNSDTQKKETVYPWSEK